MIQTWLALIGLSLAAINAQGQGSSQDNVSGISVESRISNYFQRGYELSLFRNTNKPFSFGVQIAGQRLEGSYVKELIFKSSDIDNIDIRISWLIGFKSRYHFQQRGEGFYGELSLGGEQFQVKNRDQTQRFRNGFILPSIGYIWFPWHSEGFYINPNLGYDFILFNPGEKQINEIGYELRSSFFVPAFSIGWKFMDRK